MQKYVGDGSRAFFEKTGDRIMGEIIAIVSGKGGVGKTMFTANVGAALSALGKRVVVVDADVGLRNLDLALGMETRVRYTFADVLRGQVELEHALIRDKVYSKLYLLPAPQRRYDSEKADGFRALMCELALSFDYVLIDCPAGLDTMFREATECADRCIVVTLSEVTAVRDADRVIKLLRRKQVRAELVVNRFVQEYVDEGAAIPAGQVADMLQAPLLAVLPEDHAVLIAFNNGRLLDGRWKNSLMKDAAQVIIGEKEAGIQQQGKQRGKRRQGITRSLKTHLLFWKP